ncbi:MAG: nucleotidyltransferase family protein [Candidatus Aenigmatarchaeota archaeon]
MNKIKIGVIPSAGEGKRMGYLSHILPKPLFPLYDKPIIHYIIENMLKVGVKEIYIPIFYHKEKFREYFKKTKEFINAKIHLIELKRPTRGIASTIYSVKDFIHEPFITILGDDCTITNSLQNLINIFFQKKAIVVEGLVSEKDENTLRSTCCVKLNKDNQIIEIIEKPQKIISKIRGAGIYVFNTKIFDYIEKTPIAPPRYEKEITNTIKLVAKDGKAYGEFIDGINININDPENLLKAWLIIRDVVKA